MEAWLDRLVAAGLDEPLENLSVDPPYSLEEDLRVMEAAGLNWPIENLIVDHSYLVFVVERRDREVFALLGKYFWTIWNWSDYRKDFTTPSNNCYF